MATRPAKARPAQQAGARKGKPRPAQPSQPGPAAKPGQPAKPAKPGPAAKPGQPAGSGQPAAPAAPPRELRLAAALEAAEAAGMLVAAGFAAVATAAGESYERSSGIALTLIAVGTAALFAALAAGLARARPWTRTPVVMFQLAIGVWGVFLLNGHRYEWGVPMLVLAVAILAALFTPASLRALNRPPRQP